MRAVFWSLLLVLIPISCSRPAPSGAVRLTYERLSASQRQMVEETLRELGDRCEQATSCEQPDWPTDLTLLTADDAQFDEKLRWSAVSSEAGYSYVVLPRARYGYDASSKPHPPLRDPDVWVVAYLKPAVLGNTRTAVLTTNGAVTWLSPEELTKAIEGVDAFWRQLFEILNSLGG